VTKRDDGVEEPMKNPTVVFPEPRCVEFRDVPVASPGPGQVLLRTRRTLVSTGTELTIMSGEFPKVSAWADYARYPFVVGYSAAGEVIEVGEGVVGIEVGDIVAAEAPHARFSIVPADTVLCLPSEGLSLDYIPFATLGETVMNAVRRSGVRWGDSVVVFGTGLLGQLAVRFCRLVGARPVIAVDAAPERLALVPDSGGVVAINPSDCDLPAAVAAATRNRMADVVFEVTGNPSLIPVQFALLRPLDGRFVILGSPRGATSFDFHDLCQVPSHTIIGAHQNSQPVVESLANPWTKHRNGELFFDMVVDREVDLDPMITHRLPWTSACECYERLLEDRSSALGIILDWDE
jgi:2-desacetyl-2-hydroxyethyl bacteriochlorophyllide A dehydrogenase